MTAPDDDRSHVHGNDDSQSCAGKTTLSRRAFARSAVAVGGVSALSACLEAGEDRRSDGADDSTPDDTGSTGDDESDLNAPTGVDDPTSLPDGQHVWNDVLGTDNDGNVLPPEHHVLLDLSLVAEPDDPDAREDLERAFCAVERAVAWSTDGILFTIGYTPAYFDRFDEPLTEHVDLPEPTLLSSIEPTDDVGIDTHDAALHLASDDPTVVLAVEEALFGALDELNGEEMDATLEKVFERTKRRTGFVGPGLPADHQDGLEGIPDGAPVPEEAPFFMGFRSGFRASQATEDRVTIEDGPFAGGTTQHVESLELDLHIWFEDNEHSGRIARMFSPDHATTGDVGSYGQHIETETGALNVADLIDEHAEMDGIVGHAQKLAREREDGEPLLLRRDINSTDDDVAGMHFISLQRDIGEYRRLRTAMAGEEFVQEGLDGDDRIGLSVGRRQNNGILQYITVSQWGHYLLPPREHRSLPNPNPIG
ncbi:Tat pathway signal protein [Halobacteria archaeon AArc-dxtr1]|nr:Tat pathway signal protein [Halobacteria archaeon AArc-dxtr1]